MGLTTDQLQADVHKFLDKQESIQTQKEKMAGPSAIMMGPTDVQLGYGQRFSEDVATLGKKKTWKPSESQKKKNEQIDKAKFLTERATAYTLDIYDTMQERKKALALRSDVHKGEPEVKIEEKLALLYSVKFEKRMLTTSNIRANLGDYLSYIESYKELKELKQSGVDEKYHLAERLARISGPMEVLTERVQSFLSQNRINMDGSVMKDNEEAQDFVYSREKEATFLGKQKDDLDKTRDFDAVAVDLATAHLNRQSIRQVLESGMPKINSEIPVYSEMTKWNTVERIEHIADLRSHIVDCQKRIERITDQLKTIGITNEFTMILKADKAELKRDLIETKACLLLAEAEASYVIAETEKDKQAAIERIEEAQSDYKKVILRAAKASLPGAVAVKHSGGPAGVSREEAINSRSDTENYRFKSEVIRAAGELSDQYAGLRDKLIDYASATHYSVGSEQETALLKAALKERAKFPKASEPLAKIDELLKRLTVTGKAIPKWDEIPAALKVDALKLPKGKTPGELSESELAKCDQIPKETKAGKQKGSHRNAAITAARTWVNLGKDTPLFSHEPTINDLRQGLVSNCYMIASTTGLINLDPQIIKDCIKDNEDGTVTVRLFKHSDRSDAPPVPMFIRIPKRVPKLMTGGDILSSGAIWMQLIERAAAQVGMFREDRSGYQSLWYGKGDEWLAILTGARQKAVYDGGDFVSEDYVDIHDTRDDEVIEAEQKEKLFKDLTEATEKGKIFHAGSRSEGADGLNSGHAYTVLGTKTVDGVPYVVLRNPYANMSRVVKEDGTVAKSTGFTSSTADMTCGQFSMPYEQFLMTMQSITVTEFSTAFRKEKGIFASEDNPEVKIERDLTLEEIAEREIAAKEKPKEPIEMDEDEMNDLEAEIAKELAEQNAKKGDDLDEV